MFSCARRSACTVVNTREVATSATTSTLVKMRIFWVRPTRVLVLLDRGVVLAELVLVRDRLVAAGVEREGGLRGPALGHGDVLGRLARALLPGLDRVLPRGHALDGEAAVGRDL